MKLESLLEEPLEIEIPDYMLNDPEFVGYPDLEIQTAIYRWVANDIRSDVKDFGCGRGDFSKYFNQTDYYGIDSNPIKIKVARKKYNSQFIESNWFDVKFPTSHTVFIGSLNEHIDDDKWSYFDNALKHALNVTTDSVIFVLNTDDNGYTYYPIDELVKHIPAWNPYTIDCSVFEGICKLVVFVKKFEH